MARGLCPGDLLALPDSSRHTSGPNRAARRPPLGDPRASPPAQASAASSRREGCPGGAEPTLGRPAALTAEARRWKAAPVPPSHHCARAVHLGTLRDCPLSRGWGVVESCWRGQEWELGGLVLGRGPRCALLGNQMP